MSEEFERIVDLNLENLIERHRSIEISYIKTCLYFRIRILVSWGKFNCDDCLKEDNCLYFWNYKSMFMYFSVRVVISD